MSAEISRKSLAAGSELKNPVGCFKQIFGVFGTLFVVGIQDFHVRLAAQNVCDFPGEIVAVLNSGVHPLRARRSVNVGGISGEKTSAFGEPFDAARMNAVN